MPQRSEIVRKCTGVHLDTVLTSIQQQDTIHMHLSKITIQNTDPFTKKLWLIGVDKHGYSVAVCVDNFQPSFLVKIPDDTKMSPKDAMQELVDDLEEEYSNYQLDLIADYKLKELVQLVGYVNNEKHLFVELHMASVNAYRKVSRSTVLSNYQLYHRDSFALPNIFLHQTGLQYGVWITLTHFRIATGAKKTSCNIEITCNMEHIQRKKDSVELVYNNKRVEHPSYLKAFISIQCVSRDSLFHQVGPYHPDPQLKYDRTIAVSIAYTWSNDHTSEIVANEIFTLFPLPEHNFEHLRVFSNEKHLLQAVRDSFILMDPDNILVYQDFYMPLCYLAERARLYDMHEFFHMERFKPIKTKSRSGNTYFHNVCSIRETEDDEEVERMTLFYFSSRNTMNMDNAVRKKVMILIETYDLYTVSCHPKFRKKPAKFDDLITDNFLPSRALGNEKGREQIVKQLIQNNNLIIQLEADQNMFIENMEISATTDTDLTDVVSRGEQIRVWNSVIHFSIDEGRYVNREDLVKEIPTFNAKERPPSFPDPGEHNINVQKREEHIKKLAKLEQLGEEQERIAKGKPARAKTTNVAKYIQQVKKQLEKKKKTTDKKNKDNSKEEEEEEEDHYDEKDGGSVLLPTPGLLKPLGILDFASLYPTIMMAYKICYCTLVLDTQYLDLPGVTYYTVQINSDETVVFARDETAVIPKLLHKLVTARRKVKKQMKSVEDPFVYNVLDAKQGSLKIVCNATYGFTGARKGYMGCRSIMKSVTSLGRFLQKISSYYLANVYNIHTLYGDTDSIFVYADIGEDTDKSLEEICMYAGTKYKMNGRFEGKPFTWELVQNIWHRREQNMIQQKSHGFNTPWQNMQRKHQIYAIWYLIYEKICEELTEKLYIPPVLMEFENLATNVWMGNSKKCYVYIMMDPNDPSRVEKFKYIGMAAKKRDWCLYTRKCLKQVTEHILLQQEHKIVPFLEQKLSDLVHGNFKLEDIRISKKAKSLNAYKSRRQIHVNLVERMTKRYRWPVRPGSRIFYVVTRGKTKLYRRGEEPNIVREKNMKIDILFYLQNQLEKPMRTLLKYHRETINFEHLLQKYVRLAKNDANGFSITSKVTKRMPNSSGMKSMHAFLNKQLNF
jgi:DNA polymerase elongation subunit (family B)